MDNGMKGLLETEWRKHRECKTVSREHMWSGRENLPVGSHSGYPCCWEAGACGCGGHRAVHCGQLGI